MKIIPLPKKYNENEGVYRIDGKVKSEFDLPLISEYITPDNNASFEILKDSAVPEEGYTLLVTPERLVIKASTKIGAYYALQSVRRLCDFDLGGRDVPCCEIEDEPRFKWRGLHLDESRHFFGKDTVKVYLDRMFSEKLNVFHWHLTDDAGWRIEIKKYPLLTEIGSKRKYSQIGGWESLKCDDKEHSGFYTQEDIRELVSYAKERGITVVPEIDFPAHCASAMAAYPELACFPKETEVPGYFGGLIPQMKYGNFRWNRTLCCGKDSTFDFVFGVLSEVCELFDSKYIHVGGDEAPLTEWKKCPLCQGVMKNNNLRDETELQGWFENKVIAFLKEKGKTVIGWNEVINSQNLNNDGNSVVIQYWTPKRDKTAEKYANCGGAMILSNHQSFYFDMPYAMYPLSSTYNYNPSDYGITSADKENILGVEGEVWTEWIEDRDKLDLNTVPRIQALSEVAWSPEEKRDFSDFKKRLDMIKPVLKNQGINLAEDEIANAENKSEAHKTVKLFRRGNPYYEVELNRKIKAKGDK